MWQKLIQYLKGVQAEMVKVSWPTRTDVTGATTLVIVFSVVVAVIIKIFDMVLGRLLGLLLNI
jgi:preprotein translocase SecE subunit